LPLRADPARRCHDRDPEPSARQAASGRNSATEDKFPQAVLPGTFDFSFTTGLSYKDVRLCVDEAEALGVPMVVGSAVRAMLAATRAKIGPGVRLHLDRPGGRGVGGGRDPGVTGRGRERRPRKTCGMLKAAMLSALNRPQKPKARGHHTGDRRWRN
jgi:NAD-binding of NADP-dependent 3-hydroxyisobutyrate dehydrogenase